MLRLILFVLTTLAAMFAQPAQAQTYYAPERGWHIDNWWQGTPDHHNRFYGNAADSFGVDWVRYGDSYGGPEQVGCVPGQSRFQQWLGTTFNYIDSEGAAHDDIVLTSYQDVDCDGSGGPSTGPWTYSSATMNMYRCSDGVWRYPSSIAGFTERCEEDAGVAAPEKNKGPCPDQCELSKINAGNGNRFEPTPGYEAQGDSPLAFDWSYNSLGGSSDPAGAMVGHHRTTTYSRRLKYFEADGVESVYVERPIGTIVRFDKKGGQWINSGVGGETLTGAHSSAWVFESADGSRDHYLASGRLQAISDSNDRRVEIEYDGAGRIAAAVDPYGRSLVFAYSETGRLSLLSQPDGSAIAFEYDAGGMLSKVTYPGAGFIQYRYDEAAHVDGAQRVGLLTSVIDENGDATITKYDSSSRAYRTIKSGLVTQSAAYTDSGYGYHSSAQITGAEGATTAIDYTVIKGRILPTSVTRSCSGCVGTTTVYVYDADGRLDRIIKAGIVTDLGHDARALRTRSAEALTEDEPAACPADSTYYPDTYGAPCSGGSCWATSPFAGSSDGALLGYPGQYFSCKLPATFANIAGISRETQTDWHATLRVPVAQRLYDSSQALVARTTWTHNSRGQVLAQTDIDPDTSATRVTTLAYCEAADVPSSACPLRGLLKSVNGPRTDVPDITTYTYYAADAAGCATGPATCTHRKGDLWKVTNPLGQVTEILGYDGAGRVRSVKDVAGVVTDLQYNARGWLTASLLRGANPSSELDDQITQLDYFANGQVQKVTQPDGATLSFTYDGAQRLTSVTDSVGNTVTYTLDDNGNRTQEDTRNASAVLVRTMSRVHDALGRLLALRDADLDGTDFTYAADGTVETVTDALGRISDFDHDALGRLRTSIANVGGASGQTAQTSFEYDARDNLVEVVDPKGLTTGYGYNGLGDLVLLGSPDTGFTTYGYDSAGNRASQLDARGISTLYSYDALNRVTGIDLPTAGQDIAFSYDSAPTECAAGETSAAGRLQQFTDASGWTRYCYDARGNTVRKVQSTTSGPTQTLRYGYTAANRMASVTYPSGLVVTYTRNANGQINGVVAKNSSTEAPVTLVTDATYLPFGPLHRLTYGNGRLLDKNYDLDYGIESVADSASAGLAIGYSLDAAGNVVGLAERQNGGAIAARTVEYDGLDRLTALKNGATAVQGFAYDATGNRTSKVSGTSATYQYGATSHRLTKVGAVNRSYDAAGNSTAIGTRTYQYDDRGRMSRSLNGTTPLRDYRYNALGQRVAKLHPTTATASVFYVYDEAGRLMGEYQPNGTLLREYIWLDDTLVATRAGYAGHKFQYVLTDHLNTPRAVVLPSSNAIIWRWDITNTAFGEHAALNNPDGDAANYTFNLRYPGQYFDAETGLHYNYFRDYDPSTGRYVQSDPIGLGGGISTYGYVGGRPLNLFDRWGLDAETILFNPYRQDLQDSDTHLRAENRLLLSAQAYNSPEGVYTIAGHGAPGRVRDDAYRIITPQQLWDMIKDEYEGGDYESIRLAVCDAGRDDKKGFNFARELARISGQSVEASPHYVGYPRNGNIFLGDPVPNSATPKVVPNPALRWTTFP